MDYSFLKLYKNDFPSALKNDNLDLFAIQYSGFIQMSTKDVFLQISNCKENIAFGGNLKAEIINNCQEVLLDITDDFFYKEFTNSKGIKQIAFSFGNIGIEFYETVHLKLSHIPISDNVWYSNPFIVSDSLLENTTLFWYKNESYFNGVDYDRANYFQKIRIAVWQDDVDIQEESEEYTQLSGYVISSRKVITNIQKYSMYACDIFTYKRLVNLLSHDIIYSNNYRITNKPKVTKGERKIDSNFFELNFDTNPSEEYLANFYEIYEPLMLIQKFPFGNYILGSVIQNVSGTFNKNISIGTGIIQIIGRQTFTTFEISLPTNKSFLVNTATLQNLPLGTYRVEIESTLFGVSETWEFSIINADYDSTDYDSNDYLT